MQEITLKQLEDIYKKVTGEEVIPNKDLKKRILDISFRHRLSHLSSCLEAVDIINEIFEKKKPDEKFVCSQGHVGLSLFVVIEKFYEDASAEEILDKSGIHPDRLASKYIDCSTGSLGQGLPIAVGMAIADRSKNVYCLISDGECMEGSIWEALRIADSLNLTNLKIYVNINGFSAYDKVDTESLIKKLSCFAGSIADNIYIRETTVDALPFLEGLKGHYAVMSEEDYKFALEALNENR